MRRIPAGLVLAVVAAPFLVMPPADAATARCVGHRATVVGDARSEVLTGTPGNDVIVGRGGDDTIDGRGGNDIICGGFGLDRLTGGPGNDRLFGGKDRVRRTDEGGTERIGDVLRGGPGRDRLVPGRDTRRADDVSPDTILWDDAARAVHLDLARGVATGQGRDTFVSRGAWVVGSRFGDRVEGSGHRDLINGGRGPDVLLGGAGNDRIVADVGAGNETAADLVRGGDGADEISAEGGEDRLYGGRGRDVLDDFGDSADQLFGGPGVDLLVGEVAGDDARQRYVGGAGVDQLSLFTNNLNPTADPSTGTWNMRTGRLTYDLDGPVTLDASGFEHGNLSTYGTTWTVRGTGRADELSAAGTKGTRFFGLTGNDRFLGSDSDDLFAGGAGTDRSLGMGIGDDTCRNVEVFDYGDCENVTP